LGAIVEHPTITTDVVITIITLRTNRERPHNILLHGDITLGFRV
jgi:hypothetical protein